MIIVGIDPDSNKHGVAVYLAGQLSELHNFALLDLRRWIDAQFAMPLMFSIEDVCSQNFVYTRNAKASKAAHAQVALSVGRCQQSQTEVMRELDSRGIPYELHKPSGGNWADNKARFEKVTGWKGRSNPETRSAAYFGYLAVMKATKEVRKPIKVSTFSGRVEVMRG